MIIGYSILVFVSFSIDDLASTNSISDAESVTMGIKIAEIVILSFFLVEIFCKIYVYGLKVKH